MANYSKLYILGILISICSLVITIVFWKPEMTTRLHLKSFINKVANAKDNIRAYSEFAPSPVEMFTWPNLFKGKDCQQTDAYDILAHPNNEALLRREIGRTMWTSIQPKLKCPTGLLKRLGNSWGGGKITCGVNLIQPEDCLVYSIGVSTDSTFEADLLNAVPLCRIYAYDHTVRKMGSPILPNDPRVRFTPFGIGGNDTGNIKTLKTLMKLNGHENRQMDIFKIDVEGAEFEAFDNILKDFPGKLPFKQVQVEVHTFHGWDWESLGMVLEFFRKLERRGLYVFSQEFNPFYAKYGDMKANGCCSEFSLINTNSSLWTKLQNFVEN